VSAVYHQSRKRTREEGGETILEDQDLVFTERRVTWPSKAGVGVGENIGVHLTEDQGGSANTGEGMEAKVEAVV
jgi:hypothetical protein